MIQAIETKYLGPTNEKQGRIKAHCDAGSKTTIWNHSLDQYQNHYYAAKALATKLGWEGHGQLHGGSLPGANKGYAFVFVK